MRPEATDTTTVYTLEQLSEMMMPYVRRRGMRWARVFGSYARDEATGASDIDVVVDVGSAKLSSVFGLMEHIYQASGKQPDVYDISELLPGPFRDTVLKEAVPL